MRTIGGEWPILAKMRPKLAQQYKLVDQWTERAILAKRANRFNLSGWGQSVGWCEALEWVVGYVLGQDPTYAADVIERYEWFVRYARYTEDEYNDSAYSDIRRFWDDTALQAAAGLDAGEIESIFPYMENVLDLLASLNPDIYDHHDLPVNMYDCRP